MAKVTGLNSVRRNNNWAAEGIGAETLCKFPAKIDAAQFRDSFGRKIQVNGAIAYGATSITCDALVDSIPKNVMLDFGTWEAVTVTVSDVSISAGDTTFSVLPLTGTIPVGTVLDFSGGTNAQLAKTTVIANKGDTALTVAALDGTIANGSTATFAAMRKLAFTTSESPVGSTTVAVKALAAPLADNDVARYTRTQNISVKAGTVVGRTYTERTNSTGFGPANPDTDHEIFIVAFDIPDVFASDDVELVLPKTSIKFNRLPEYNDWTAMTAPSNTITGAGATTGGILLTATNYLFKATYVMANGMETEMGGTSAAITIASGSTGSILLSVLGIVGNQIPDGAVGVNIYMSVAAGEYKLIARNVTADSVLITAPPDAGAKVGPTVGYANRFISKLRDIYNEVVAA